jgi:hypothetical protein
MVRTPPTTLALSLALAVVVLAPTLSGHEQFFYRDVTRQYAPLQAQLDRAWSRRELPLWNDSTQAGVPLLANLHAGALAPWWPLFRAFDFHRAYATSVALVLAAWLSGMYALFRRRVEPAAAALGALAGGLSGVVLSATTYLPLLAGAACIPWQLRALDASSRVRGVLALAALFTLQVLTGDPSTAIMGALACAVFIVTWRAPARLSWLATGGALALGLSAVQWLPAWTLYGESARAASSLETRLGWSFHPARTLEWLVRRPWGGLLEPPFFARWDLTAGPDPLPFLLEHGWGVLGVLCAGAALARRGSLRPAGLTLVALGFALSLGRHLGPLRGLFDLPPLSLFRFPERYAVLTALGAAALVAQGAAHLLDAPAARRRWAFGWLGLGALAALTALSVDGPPRPAMLSLAGLLVSAGVLALTLSRARWAWLGAVVALAGFEGWSAVTADVLTLPAEPLPSIATAPRAPHRVWRENAPLRGIETLAQGRDALAEERRRLHRTFASATPGLHGVDELGGYSPVALRRWQRVLQVASQRPDLLSQLFDVCWFVTTPARGAANPGWATLETLAPSVQLFESKRCLGRAWAVTQVLPVRDTDEALQRLAAPGFDASATATVEGPPAPAHRLDAPRVTVRPRTRASRLELDVEPQASKALVVVSEAWSPGWRAWVDGAECPVEVLDGALLGVAVPAGGQRVRFEYEEPLWSAGLAWSLCTALGLALWWVRRHGPRGLRRRRGQAT